MPKNLRTAFHLGIPGDKTLAYLTKGLLVFYEALSIRFQIVFEVLNCGVELHSELIRKSIHRIKCDALFMFKLSN